MTFLETVRNKSFWFLDAIRGNPIGKHYKEIKTVLADYNSDEAQAIINNNLSSLIDHAASTTPFYKDYKGISDINKFPIISKITVKEQYEDFKSSTFLGKNNYLFESTTEVKRGETAGGKQRACVQRKERQSDHRKL